MASILITYIQLLTYIWGTDKGNPPNTLVTGRHRLHDI